MYFWHIQNFAKNICFEEIPKNGKKMEKISKRRNSKDLRRYSDIENY
jgi:hypothetical protein